MKAVIYMRVGNPDQAGAVTGKSGETIWAVFMPIMVFPACGNFYRGHMIAGLPII